MKLIHDIRQQIPQFSANFFGPYVHQDYPRMMVNRDTGKPYLDATKKPIAVDSLEKELEFWASKGIKAKAVKNNARMDVVFESVSAAPVIETAKAIEIPVVAQAVVSVMRQPFEALTPKQAEKAVAANETVAPKRRGRPPSVKLPADLK